MKYLEEGAAVDGSEVRRIQRMRCCEERQEREGQRQRLADGCEEMERRQRPNVTSTLPNAAIIILHSLVPCCQWDPRGGGGMCPRAAATAPFASPVSAVPSRLAEISQPGRGMRNQRVVKLVKANSVSYSLELPHCECCYVPQPSQSCESNYATDLSLLRRVLARTPSTHYRRRPPLPHRCLPPP